LLLAAPAPRVVVTSSQAHRMGRMHWDDPHGRSSYRKWPAYGQSKLANLLFMFELDRRARAHGTNLLAAAAHPGYAATHLQNATYEMSGNRVMTEIINFANRFIAQSDEHGAWPQLYGATMPDAEGGTYYGPSGAFEMKGHPTVVKSIAAARRPEDGQRLWELSERETGVTYKWL
jgi:NAD(P)-dependent dehydrogenase (short-subunit alcohol dehydrogenase family)